MVEPACSDTVFAALVLLDLLIRQIKRLAEVRLAHPQQGTPLPNAAADMNVNWMRAVFGDGAPFSSRHTSPRRIRAYVRVGY